MDMTLKEFKLITSNSWSQKNQPLTIDISRDKCTGRYRLGLSSIVVPDKNTF